MEKEKNNELAAAGNTSKKDLDTQKNECLNITSTNEHVVKLSKSYKFEDEGEISSIDLSCLEDANAEVLMKASKVMTTNGDIMAIPENDIRYALFIAAECTGIPLAFYKKLSLQDAIKVKREVMSFFNGVE